ncbi:UPF0481 protein At3g47200-like [Silene latifolia]|uniref:UPF0481 protein At3g47200-like n=1 Tax=Silene latifolia TaxID=37657 RepID=UPI003D774988
MALEQQQWVIGIRHKLNQGGQVENDAPWTKHSIYKVPSWMKDGEQPNDDRIVGYIPEIISFGPYHRGEPHLQQMEAHKWRVLNHMLNRDTQDITVYLTAVQELEHTARACYESPVSSLTSNEFVEMMVLDGCFVLEFLRGTKHEFHNLGYEEKDPVFYKDSICHVIATDLMKLENQIPLIVLQKLIEIQYIDNPNINKVPELVMWVLTPRWITINAPATEKHLNHMRDVVANEHGSELEPPMVHCLDVFRRSLMYKPEYRPNTCCGLKLVRDKLIKRLKLVRGKLKWEAKSSDNCEHVMANCISDLRKAGVKFKPRNKLPFWDIQFKQCSGVLEIHPFKIDNASETVFRNLIAFEQCHMNNPWDMVVTNYVAFMDNLIDTASDVAYLHKAKIIVHYLGSDQEVADLFNRLVKKVYVNKKTGVLHDVYDKLNEYCSHRRNWWRASLQNEYLHNPWVIISIFVALLLFLLTAVQTAYTVYAYYKPPS